MCLPGLFNLAVAAKVPRNRGSFHLTDAPLYSFGFIYSFCPWVRFVRIQLSLGAVTP